MPDRDQPARYAATAKTTLGLWRYRDLLPPVAPVTLGEGWTPLLRSGRHPGLFLKDESRNPTGTYAARGISVAVSLARREGIEHLSLTDITAAAYAAAAGIRTTQATYYGAEASPIEAPRLNPAHILEGEMTLGYELCEQFAWDPPATIFCAPALIPALTQAFARLELLAWIPAHSTPRFHPATAPADPRGYARNEGFLLSPEGASAYAASVAAELPPDTQAVIINPTQGHIPSPLPTSMPVGGIITPV